MCLFLQTYASASHAILIPRCLCHFAAALAGTCYTVLTYFDALQDGKYDKLLRLLYNDIEKYETEVGHA